MFIPPFIEKEIFEKLKLREQAFLVFLYQKKYTKKQIMKKLYIDNERTFQRLQKKMSEIIKRQFDAKNKKQVEK